ncbi:MAG: lyase family protein [Minisyncoccales bacterium]
MTVFDRVQVAGVAAKEAIPRLKVPQGTALLMREWMQKNPPNEARRKEIEILNDHDYLAYVEERLENMPRAIAIWLQAGFTTFDVQDPADMIITGESLAIIDEKLASFMQIVRKRALKDKKWIMMLRTHGRMGQVGTFGKREAAWYARLELARFYLRLAMFIARFAKASGAMGSYGNTTPEIENGMLKHLELTPFIGATQILPREIHGFIAFALLSINAVLAEIAFDIWLMSRDPFPLVQEPKGKKSSGSSAMPHKRNPIKAENTLGMFNISIGDALTTLINMFNIEERIIHHSSGERVSLKDEFHATANALKTMQRVLEGLKLYPKNMMRQIIESKQAYASEAAKEFLAKRGEKYGLSRSEAYDLVKLAATSLFDADLVEDSTISDSVGTVAQAVVMLGKVKATYTQSATILGLEDIIRDALLNTSPNLDISATTVAKYKGILQKMFEDEEIREAWPHCFDILASVTGENHILDRLERGNMNLRPVSMEDMARLFIEP